MEKSKTTLNPDSPEFWENEIQYFENAMHGLNTSYAILAQLKINAQAKLDAILEPQNVD